MKRIQPADVISCTLFLILPAILPFVRRAAPPVLAAVGIYAAVILWRNGRLGDMLQKRLRQPQVLIFAAFMGWASFSLVWTPALGRGLVSISTALLLVFSTLSILELRLSESAPRLLAIGLTIGAGCVALDLMTGSALLHLVHSKPEEHRYNMVVVTYVTLAAALAAQHAKLGASLTVIVSISALAGIFVSESETAKIAALCFVPVLLTAKLLFKRKRIWALWTLLGLFWLFAVVGMTNLIMLKEIAPHDFWMRGAADDRLLVWGGFASFASAGLPFGWGIESTSAPELTSFILQASEATKLGIVGRLHPHNNLLQIAAELGMPGLLLSFFFVCMLLARFCDRFAWQCDRVLPFFAIVLLIAVISHGFWQTWWWAAVLIAGSFVLGSEGSEEEASALPQTGRA